MLPVTITTPPNPGPEVSCANCEACCCRLQVILIGERGIPDHLVEVDRWGGRSMARLEDGWCIALDRGTMKCRIYETRPKVCRDFAVGDYECLAERGVGTGDGQR